MSGIIFALGLFMQISERLPARCDALRMINLDAPQMALQGDTIQLSCSYSLIGAPARTPQDNYKPRSSVKGPPNEEADRKRARDSPPELEVIYAIKWYRDEREFFRYLAQEWPHKQAFPAEGLNIDVSI